MKRPARAAVEAAIREAGGNMTRAAALLGCTRPTLYTWVYQLDLVRLAGVRTTTPPASLAPDQLIPVSLRLPAGVWRWVRIEAIESECTCGQVVVEALEALRAIRAAVVPAAKGAAE